MPRSRHFLLLVISLILGADCLRAQSLKKLKDFKVGHVENVSIDRLGNFFLLSGNAIKKYDASGKVLAAFKADKKPTLIEPWYHPRIFVYYQQNQHYINYDRNFQNPEEMQLDPSIAVQ